MYIRVIPRDLFNESKFLKCLGQLSLLIHEGKGIRWPLKLEHDDPEKPFKIELDESNGWLYSPNIHLYCGGEDIATCSTYNSRDPYPLLAIDNEGNSYHVFNDDGSLSQYFETFLDSLKGRQKDE